MHTSPNVETENAFSNNGSVIAEATDQISLLHHTPCRDPNHPSWSLEKWFWLGLLFLRGDCQSEKQKTSLCLNPHYTERAGKVTGSCFTFLPSCTKPKHPAFRGITGPSFISRHQQNTPPWNLLVKKAVRFSNPSHLEAITSKITPDGCLNLVLYLLTLLGKNKAVFETLGSSGLWKLAYRPISSVTLGTNQTTIVILVIHQERRAIYLPGMTGEGGNIKKKPGGNKHVGVTVQYKWKTGSEKSRGKWGRAGAGEEKTGRGQERKVL